MMTPKTKQTTDQLPVVTYNQMGDNTASFWHKILCGLLLRMTTYPQDLIIAKFEVSGLSRNSLKLLLDYLKSHKQLGKWVLHTALGLT